MIYLDTHIVVWLYQKDRERFSQVSLSSIDENELFISPMVKMELEFLFEIDRITVNAKRILEFLKSRIGLKICEKPFQEVIQNSLEMKWTRDPFDRIITAYAAIDDSILITKDRLIRKHYPHALW